MQWLFLYENAAAVLPAPSNRSGGGRRTGFERSGRKHSAADILLKAFCQAPAAVRDSSRGGSMTRRELREHVFRILFACEFLRSRRQGQTSPWPDQDAVREQTDLYFTHEGGDELDFPPCDVKEEDRDEVRERTLLVSEKVPEIDKVLDETSTGWKTGRMARADLCILRLAVYELLYDDRIPTGVAMNEAVLLAKKFGGADSSSFVNGVLAKLERQRESAS